MSKHKRRTWPQKSNGRSSGPVVSHGGASSPSEEPRRPGERTARQDNGREDASQLSTNGYRSRTASLHEIPKLNTIRFLLRLFPEASLELTELLLNLAVGRSR
jgi:hypothetical protein